MPLVAVQPSELEIRREVEALRDIKRRSSAPGAIPLDPDLPELPPSPSSPHSPQAWASSLGADDTQDSDGSDDPSHLFWVPARLHPELAPGEFRAFLKEHARDGGAALQRASSASSSSSTSGLGRKKSMLSKQYKPSVYDGVEDENVLPLRRNKSSLYSNPAPQLTISDLQRLEELAEEASMSDDPSKLRSMLRRSMSLNVSPSLIDQMDDMPDIDEADSPIIVPRPGQILRRAARTKIRKPNLPGDGGGHRFASTRRGAGRAQTLPSSDVSSSDHDHEEPFPRPEAPTTELQDERPLSYSDEAFIFDAYADRRDSLTSSESNDRSDEDPRDARERTFSTSPPPLLSVRQSTSPPQPQEPPQLSRSPPPSLHHPMPQRHLPVPAAPGVIAPSRTPSPSYSDTGSTTEIASPSSSVFPSPATEVPPSIRDDTSSSGHQNQMRPYQPQPPSPSPSRKEKEKKGGLFGKWGGKEDKKKNAKAEAAREKELREQKEKESGFFGSLFGGKKKHDDSVSTPSLLHGGAGPATAAALLGASKSSKAYAPSPSPQLAGAYARYPIHVERAVYRLSHIKLANPRRPLYEQVLISNLMFWYLGVINKAQTGGTGAGAGAGAQGHSQGQAQAQEQADKEAQEREQRERSEREQKERERAEQSKRESGRKGSLTKGPRPGGERRAEMPVRGPQYESQHRAMEQEYGHGHGSQSPPVRTGSAPPAPMAGASGYHHYNNHRMSPQQMMQGQNSMQPGQYHYNHGADAQGQPAQGAGGSYSLPPGAMMPPLAIDQSWLGGQPGSPNASSQGQQSGYAYTPPNSAPPGQQQHQAPPRRPRSPPPNHLANPGHPKHPNASAPGARLQGRSLSATAVVPQQQAQQQAANGRLKKKHASAVAAPSPSRRRSSDGAGGFGDEDLPLAVWQQQQQQQQRAGGRR